MTSLLQSLHLHNNRKLLHVYGEIISKKNGDTNLSRENCSTFQINPRCSGKDDKKKNSFRRIERWRISAERMNETKGRRVSEKWGPTRSVSGLNLNSLSIERSGLGYRLFLSGYVAYCWLHNLDARISIEFATCWFIYRIWQSPLCHANFCTSYLLVPISIQRGTTRISITVFRILLSISIFNSIL